MPAHSIRLSVLNADGTVRRVSVRSVVASDLREAMALVVREQDGWFTVEALDPSLAPGVDLDAPEHPPSNSPERVPSTTSPEAIPRSLEI